jgi:hypothetical protein
MEMERPKCSLLASLNHVGAEVWMAAIWKKKIVVFCKLCNQVKEFATHLFFKCRFVVRIWKVLKKWLGLHDVASQGSGMSSIP